jgi:Tfp pilus assembly protein PilZ
MMQERRQHVRVQTPVLLEFSRAGEALERSFTRDVSESGVRFPTTVKLEIGQEIDLSLQLPARDVVLKATGQVVWIKEISRLSTPQYEIGVRFRWTEDRDRDRLCHHLGRMIQPGV